MKGLFWCKQEQKLLDVKHELYTVKIELCEPHVLSVWCVAIGQICERLKYALERMFSHKLLNLRNELLISLCFSCRSVRLLTLSGRNFRWAEIGDGAHAWSRTMSETVEIEKHTRCSVGTAVSQPMLHELHVESFEHGRLSTQKSGESPEQIFAVHLEAQQYSPQEVPERCVLKATVHHTVFEWPVASVHEVRDCQYTLSSIYYVSTESSQNTRGW